MTLIPYAEICSSAFMRTTLEISDDVYPRYPDISLTLLASEK